MLTLASNRHSLYRESATMLESVAGAASVAVAVLAYLLIVECLIAMIALLTEFLVARLRRLWSLVPSPQGREAHPQEGEPDYQVGGGLIRW